jgi:hypothetical protein
MDLLLHLLCGGLRLAWFAMAQARCAPFPVVVRLSRPGAPQMAQLGLASEVRRP